MTWSVPRAMAAFAPALPLAVAYSGGADSTALLLACVHQWPGQVSAIHVHHGLQAKADDFANHCRMVCGALGVPLRIMAVDAHHAPGQSPEDAARRARYQALCQAVLPTALDLSAQPAVQTIAVAHHADDQVETLLLALSRGAGLPGLSAMPQQWMRGSLTFCRPLLHVSAAELRSWLADKPVAFIEDPTNVVERFTRNRIRAHLLPALQVAFPHFRDTVVRSAAHAAQAQVLLQEVAQQDLELVGLPPHIALLQGLSRPRLANVLRYWLKTSHQVVPRSTQLNELMDQIMTCTTRAHRLHIKVGHGFCRRRDECLDWYNFVPFSPFLSSPCP